MPKLPVISGADAVRAFVRAGWRVDRQRGSHVILLKSGMNVSLFIHNIARSLPAPYDHSYEARR